MSRNMNMRFFVDFFLELLEEEGVEDDDLKDAEEGQAEDEVQEEADDEAQDDVWSALPMQKLARAAMFKRKMSTVSELVDLTAEDE